MVEGGIYTIALPLGRSLAGFLIGMVLGIGSGWIAITFNLMVDLPWALEVHRNIYLVSVGLGAGIGSYLAWVNLGARWYLIMGRIFLVFLGGILGTYIGYAYGQVADPSYLGQRYTIDSMLHLGAAIGGIAVASVLGFIDEIRTLGR